MDTPSPESYLGALAIVAALCVSATIVGLLVGHAAERLAFRGRRKVFDLKLKRGQVAKEALGTALFHLVFVPVAALALHLGWIRFSDGWLANVLGFAGPWFGFQLFYYPFHRALHHRRLFWAHRWHHHSLVTTPMTGFSMHPAEAVGWCVGLLSPLIALSAFDLLGGVGFGVFFGVFWIGNIAGHANAEIVPVPSSWASTFISNPISYHSLHHARFDGHYGFVAATFDRLFGTEWSDWLAVHRRVFGGEPLTSLRQRLDADVQAPSDGAE